MGGGGTITIGSVTLAPPEEPKSLLSLEAPWAPKRLSAPKITSHSMVRFMAYGPIGWPTPASATPRILLVPSTR